GLGARRRSHWGRRAPSTALPRVSVAAPSDTCDRHGAVLFDNWTAAMLNRGHQSDCYLHVISGFVIVLGFLVCLLCPCCPLQRLLDRCIRRNAVRKGKETTNCLKDCCSDETSSSIIEANFNEKYPYGGIQPGSRSALKPSLSRYITLNFSVTRQSDCLVVYLYKADGTPGPKLGLCHNNFAQVQLSDARQTRFISHTMSPVFNETLILSMPSNLPADRLSLCIQCMDYDRFSRERVIGEVRVPLPVDSEQTVQYNSVLSEPPLTEKGEILIALHYMPTAERLIVMLLKANNVLTQERRIPVLLANGSAAFKKRTRLFEESSRPVFNESVTVSVPRHSLGRVTLIVSLMNCHLRKRIRPDLDNCLGYVVFSSSCYGSGK
uniref:C2 domain-containing protein n=1 Tax=Macrostomum lignano TaxID=282301 RepID=A0A1I8I3E7_9PLAT